MADDPAYDFEIGFSMSAWVYQTSIVAGTIVGKTGEFELSVNESGIVSFSVSTDQGTFVVESEDSLQVNQWSQIEGGFLNGVATVSIGRKISSTPAFGVPFNGSADLVIGSEFVGNLDHVLIKEKVEGSSLVTIDGLDINGMVTMDELGEGAVTIRSTGQQTTPLERITIFAEIVDPVSGLKITPRTRFTAINIVEDPVVLGHVLEAVEGFATGQGQGAGGFVGDVVAGVFIWGDVRDCAIQTYYLLPWNGEEVDWFVFGFAGAGLVLELFPVAGDPLDAVLSAVKVALKRLPDGKFKLIIARIPIRMADIYVDAGGGKAGRDAIYQYADELWEFMQYLFDELPQAQLEVWAEVLVSSKKFEIAIRLFRIGGTDSFAVVSGFEKVVGKRFIKVLGGWEDAYPHLVETILQSVPATTTMCKLFDEGVGGSSNLWRKFASNSWHVGDYDQMRVLADLDRLLPGIDDFETVSSWLNKLAAPGDAHELVAAIHLLDNQIGTLKKFVVKQQSLGLDLLTSTTAYNVKSSVGAITDPKYFGLDFKSAKEYLNKTLTEMSKDDDLAGKAWCLMVPDNVAVPQWVKDAIEDAGLNLQDSIIKYAVPASN
jgi:Concanavalin A-like lectin/glucanases superfamily